MSALVSPVLVGRRSELGLFAAAVERAAAGQAGFVLVGGEAGVGKTRLVEEATRAAGDDARVLAGACVQLGGEGVPFAPLVDHIRMLAATEGGELDALLGPAREELARLLPELGAAAPGPLPIGAGEASRLFELVLGVIGRLAQDRLTLLVFEDLHWADRSTIDLLAFLVRTLRAGRALVVGTYRTEEIHRRHPLRPLLLSLKRVRAVERIALEPLTRAEIRAQLEAIEDGPVDPVLAERVWERSEGNAFLAEELLGATRRGADIDQLSPSLRDLLLARAEQLAPATRHVLRVAAVAGRRVPDPLLAAVAGLGDAERIDALREATEHQLLVADDAGYAFRHELVREAVYEDMLPAERVRLHTAFGTTVEADPALAGDEASAAAALAHHWYAAHDMPRALPAAVQAARHATAAYAPGDAKRHLEWALEIWPQVPEAEERTGVDRVGLVELAVSAAIAAGDDGRALALVDEALAEVDRVAQPERAALLLERRSDAVRWKGTGHQLAALEEAAALLPGEPTAAGAVILAGLGRTRLMHGELSAADAAAGRAAEVARAVGDRRMEASALTTRGSALAYSGEVEAGVATLREARAIAQEIGDHDQALRAALNLSDVVAGTGDHGEAVAIASEAIGLAQRVGRLDRWGYILSYNLAEALVSLGRWDEAEQALAAATEVNPPSPRAIGLYELSGSLALLRGRLDEAERQLELVRRVAPRELDLQEWSASKRLEAAVHHARGDLDTAREAVEEVLEDDGVRELVRQAWPVAWLGLRIAADDAGRRRDRGEPPDAEHAERVAAWGARLSRHTAPSRGYAALCAAERARVDGDAAADVWSGAVAAWRDAGQPAELAYALLRLAEAQLAGGRRADAEAALREVSSIVEALGAAPLAAEARMLARLWRLSLDGDAPREDGDRGADRFGLTDREREILQLVADGRSNAQIAEVLYISPKTASVHVSNIIRKLGVTGRVEAAAVAHRQGLLRI